MSPSGSVLFACTIPPISALSLSEFRLGLTQRTQQRVCVCVETTERDTHSILMHDNISSQRKTNYISKIKGGYEAVMSQNKTKSSPAKCPTKLTAKRVSSL